MLFVTNKFSAVYKNQLITSICFNPTNIYIQRNTIRYLYQVLNPDENIHVYAREQALVALDTSSLEFHPPGKVLVDLSLFRISCVPGQ